MKKALVLLLAVLMILVGLLWTGQGLGYIGGSTMTGVATWAIIGPILAGLGVALLISALHRRN